jgi:hypothetical protein
MFKIIKIKYLIYTILIFILIYACKPRVRTTEKDLKLMKTMQVYSEKASNCDEKSIRYLYNYDRWNSSLRNGWIFNGAVCGIPDFEFMYLEKFRSLSFEDKKNKIQKVEILIITKDKQYENNNLYKILKKMKDIIN